TLLRSMNAKEDLAKMRSHKLEEYNKIKEKENQYNIYLENFRRQKENFDHKSVELFRLYQEKYKNKNLENKNFYDPAMLEFTSEEKSHLLKIRADPYYFFEKDELKKSKKGEGKLYKEIKIPNKDE